MSLGQEPYPELELGRPEESAYSLPNPGLPNPNPGDLGPIWGPARPHSPAEEASAQKSLKLNTENKVVSQYAGTKYMPI